MKKIVFLTLACAFVLTVCMPYGYRRTALRPDHRAHYSTYHRTYFRSDKSNRAKYAQWS